MSKGSFLVGVDVGKDELRAAVKRQSQKSCRFTRYQIQQRSVTQTGVTSKLVLEVFLLTAI